MRKNVVLTGVVVMAIGACFLLGGLWLRLSGDIYSIVAQAQGSQNALIIGASGLFLGIVLMIVGRILKKNVASE